MHLDKSIFDQIENYMSECMKDSAHDKEHIYRVLYLAMDIAQYENDVDKEVLITACLLHDIGRTEQFRDPKLRHEQVGSQKAYDYLIKNNWSENCAQHIRDCILSHRYRSDNPPSSIEAKILFDADKLDDRPSFFQEYKYKLEKLYDKFYTQRGMQIASERRSSAVSFYNSMFQEVCTCYTYGMEELSKEIN